MARKGFSTRQVHGAGQVPTATPRVTPIYLTAGFTFGEYGDAAAHFGEGEGYAYTRIGNPTVEAVEETLAGLESGSQALLLASGQAATSIAVLSLVSAGGHIVSSTHIYEGTRGLFLDVLGRYGIEVDFIDDIGDPAAWEAAIRPETRVLFAESVSNGSNRILDIAAVADVAHRNGLALVVDNTVATPYLVRPIEHGADVVVHSASKFLAGHGAVLGGAIIDSGTFDAERAGTRFAHLTTPARGETVSTAERTGGDARIAYAREAVAPRLGPTPSPINAFLIGQGIETLSLRVERQNDNALRVVELLADHPAVATVDHPALPTHPDHALVERYLPQGAGSVFTVTLHGGAPAAQTFIEALRVITHMTHIGDVRSLALHPASTSHVHLSPEQRAAVGVFDGTVRLSIGIEDVADLIEDVTAALAATAASASSEAAPAAPTPASRPAPVPAS